MIKMKDLILSMINESTKAKKYLELQINYLLKISEIIYETLDKGNKLLVFGNGGSAADAQHIATELVGRFKEERKGLAAIALTTDTSFLTAWSNDYEDGFKTIFERQVEALAQPKDILWGISTSGNSENLLRAFKKGHEIGTYNFSLTGRDGGKLKELSDLNINIPLYNTPRIQEAHQLAYHIICEIVDNYFLTK
ncbi:MAG: phosphoheptose isomerase [Candidatus Parcubacteria bacterium]|nr:MAG: phosphoheptose isomerase [Candidatus Pacearchaeota archaeon]GIW65364.1 MAG: phosphoheptose isomerase [Candidatus Parcubacteria bacterium]